MASEVDRSSPLRRRVMSNNALASLRAGSPAVVRGKTQALGSAESSETAKVQYPRENKRVCSVFRSCPTSASATNPMTRPKRTWV